MRSCHAVRARFGAITRNRLGYHAAKTNGDSSTWATVSGAAQEAYWSDADKRCVLPLFEPFPGTRANPVLVQGRFGGQGNFELIAPSSNGGLIHFWRNNDNGFLPWSGPIYFGGSLGMVESVSMIESNFGTPGNIEVVCQAGGQLYFFWRDSGPRSDGQAASERATASRD